jgi:GGDEF domain-containing protein
VADHLFPPPPETIRCKKCLRDVVIASSEQKTMQSDCLIADCPITKDPDNQPGELWGTSISFAEPSDISQDDRIARFEEWDRIGVETIRAGLQRGGKIYIGQRAAEDLAWEWVRSKETQELPTSRQSREIVSLDLKTLHKRLVIISAVAGAAVVIIPEDQKREIVTLLWTNTVSVPPLPLSVIAVVLLSIFYVVNLLLYNISSREKAAWQLSKAADYTFRKTQKMKETDIATGIPNQIKLAADLKFRASLAKGGKQSQLIMIDLDNFRKLNQLYNHQKGDEVISYVAQSIYNTMRRNEEIYRHSAGFVPPMDYTFRRVYRKYAGGDEFIFLISGDETEALGFLVRLQNQFKQELTPHISGHLLPERWPLQFHAGVCDVDEDDTVEQALGRVSECLRLARREGSTSRVFWSSRKTAKDFPEVSFQHQIYKKASAEFQIE